ncbi:DNA polymerase V [Atlantibacter hermannii]|uniref:DNA polymerase V n=1 Tax=Atlantibacter hermannii TaxID=565 RepID=UPI003076082D
MPRLSDIRPAFYAALHISPKGKRTVTTRDFVAELAKRKHDWSLHEANVWIEHHIDTFKDISTQEGEERTFMLYNPNQGGF